MTTPMYDVLLSLERDDTRKITKVWASKLAENIPDAQQREIVMMALNSKPGCSAYIKEYKKIMGEIPGIHLIDTRIYKYSERPEIKNEAVEYKMPTKDELDNSVISD